MKNFIDDNNRHRIQVTSSGLVRVKVWSRVKPSPCPSFRVSQVSGHSGSPYISKCLPAVGARGGLVSLCGLHGRPCRRREGRLRRRPNTVDAVGGPLAPPSGPGRELGGEETV